MATVVELIALLERGARRLTAEVASARQAGKPVESLRGQADAFLLLAYELTEEGDPAALLESLDGMERAAAWTARLDEEQAAVFLAEGQAGAGRFHSALYSHGLLEGYRQVRGLLGTWSGPTDEPAGE
jgi:hypothetical protein